MERTLKKKRANYKNLSERDERRGKGKSGNFFLPQVVSLFTTLTWTGVNNVSWPLVINCRLHLNT